MSTDRRHRALVALGAGAALAGALGTGYALQRAIVGRWRAGPEQVSAAGLDLPGDLLHHFVPVDDGGRIHVVERGHGPAVVLVHGVTLGIGIWAPQLRQLAAEHRVLAVGLRGHGQSLAGDDGYSLERLADDLLEVLRSLDVRSALLVGHSLGGMAVQLLAVRHPAALRAHVTGVVLVATTAGQLPPGVLGTAVVTMAEGTAGRGLHYAERRGRGVLAQRDLGTWLVRAIFGSQAPAAAVELTRSMTVAMSPSAMAGLLEPLLRFDVRQRLGAIDRPTKVVVGTRDVITPPWHGRQIATGIPGAELVVLPGCGHMAMLERTSELNELVHRFSLECSAAPAGNA